ncbi:MAG: hypothetical protein KHZ99_14665 [Clostridium sp.]|uniref:hypothetical protein n=1 Tax=Clostridium TaxID=1485 RepID=UPI0025B83154|nr:hypothetical protein [Clostridium sp.]MBS4958272.1 hypothetical protein [Clostridium sp.]MDU2155358.1 hypothetical protein [Clostridium sp.]
MNIQGKINKLLQAFRAKGYILKINTEQFLSEDESRMMTKYILYESHPKKGEVFYSKIKLLIYLAELYKKVGGSSG